ncbi:MAG: AAA family ATPase, partial [Candidatus Altiarchaeales archaeon]|nr:AAA family ATPase [Candidatus Altiarchaeales archaeon]
MQLNPEQQKVVDVEEGPILVLAGAGTGKTRTLTARATRLILDGLPPDRLLLLTFTNKAAGEMKERMSKQVGNLANRIWAGTFHSIASRILHRHATKLGFGYSFAILDDEDSKSLMKRCIKDGKLDKVEGMPAPRVICSLISKSINAGETLAALIQDARPDFKDIQTEIEKAAKLYKIEKKNMDAMDFDDLLRFWVLLLKKEEDVRDLYSSQFKHILVDEYQDTNKLQNRAIKLLAKNHQNITAVGDDHQSIYAFRGAQFRNILEFEHDWPGCKVFTIEQNYRSSPQILQVANASIAQNVAQRPKNLFSEKRPGSKPVLKVCPNMNSQARALISDLKKRKFSIPLEKMAVLYRSHHQSMEVQIELSRAKI